LGAEAEAEEEEETVVAEDVETVPSRDAERRAAVILVLGGFSLMIY